MKKDHGRLPQRVHLIVALGCGVSAFILAKSEGVVWLLAMGMMTCSAILYIQRINEDKDKK